MKQTKKRNKRTKQRGGLSFRKNIKNKKIKVCSKQPMTGYYRDGYCMTGPDDYGTHTVCAKLDKEVIRLAGPEGFRSYLGFIIKQLQLQNK